MLDFMGFSPRVAKRSFGEMRSQAELGNEAPQHTQSRKCQRPENSSRREGQGVLPFSERW